MKKYNIIYADPPWKYNRRTNAATRFGLGVHGHYPTMTLDEIKSLDIQSITAENCMLFMWVTFPRLKEGLEVIKVWGFTYKTLGFSWIKTNRKNNNPFFGIGFYTKSNCEVCLIAVKGKPIKISNYVSSVIISPVQEHSRKPAIVRERIVQLCGNIPRIELFARSKITSWDSWGEEVSNDVEILEFKEFSNKKKSQGLRGSPV
ncbi:MAG: MT-A70 family methyltransferase [Chitinophagaceae bacterium]|jgi:N6-adenosine-specific RNA methylase IME4